MQIDRELVNRALLKAGQTPLTDADIENNAELWKTTKAYYLQTILETLTRTPWTSAKKRARLTESEEDNLSTYNYAYDLPVDCARAMKLNSSESFVVEGNILYTNDNTPILLYITNGKLPEDEETETQEDEVTEEETTEETTEEETEEDIPGYATLEYDPNFWEYIETRLASKMVLKITGDTSLYNMLFQEASIIEQTAAKASKASGKSKPNGQEYWTDEVTGR